jgi:hypothetical protein
MRLKNKKISPKTSRLILEWLDILPSLKVSGEATAIFREIYGVFLHQRRKNLRRPNQLLHQTGRRPAALIAAISGTGR